MGFKLNLPIGVMVGDVLRSFFSKPVTRRYPFERKEAPEAFRGKLVWDLSHCTGCQLCVKDCPANALELQVIDRASKRFLMIFHSDRCTYCSQCVVNCRFKCLDLTNDQWELAALDKRPFTVYYGQASDVDAFKEAAEAEEEAEAAAAENLPAADNLPAAGRPAPKEANGG